MLSSPSLIQKIIAALATLMFVGCANAKQPVEPTKNIRFNQHGQLLDLYMPKKADKKTAIMFIHGGGFKSGDKKDMSGFAKLYAQGGFVTTSINYRLTPKHTFPAPVNDASDALHWMKRNANKYGYNPNKIVVVGYSAGGTLALNLGLDPKKKVAATVSVAPAIDIGLLIKSAPLPALKDDLKVYMGGVAPVKGSPLSQANKKSSPVFLFHGDKDIIIPVSQSLLMAKKLKKHNVPVLMRVFPNAGHEIMLPNKHLKQLLKEMTDFILAVEAKK